MFLPPEVDFGFLTVDSASRFCAKHSLTYQRRDTTRGKTHRKGSLNWHCRQETHAALTVRRLVMLKTIMDLAVGRNGILDGKLS